MREKLIELLEDTRANAAWHHWGYEESADYLISNDVVQVVRCKDCKHWDYEFDDVGLCTTDVPDIDGIQRHACDFCSYGERKDNGRKTD